MHVFDFKTFDLYIYLLYICHGHYLNRFNILRRKHLIAVKRDEINKIKINVESEH